MQAAFVCILVILVSEPIGQDEVKTIVSQAPRCYEGFDYLLADAEGVLLGKSGGDLFDQIEVADGLRLWLMGQRFVAAEQAETTAACGTGDVGQISIAGQLDWRLAVWATDLHDDTSTEKGDGLHCDQNQQAGKLPSIVRSVPNQTRPVCPATTVSVAVDEIP